jgi:hypothetical protein
MLPYLPVCYYEIDCTITYLPPCLFKSIKRILVGARKIRKFDFLAPETIFLETLNFFSIEPRYLLAYYSLRYIPTISVRATANKPLQKEIINNECHHEKQSARRRDCYQQ